MGMSSDTPSLAVLSEFCRPNALKTKKLLEVSQATDKFKLLDVIQFACLSKIIAKQKYGSLKWLCDSSANTLPPRALT